MDFLIDSPISETNFNEIINFLDLNETDTVIDIGCGRGTLLLSLFNSYQCRGVGVDISNGRIEVARQRTGNNEQIELHLSDINDFPQDRRFDLVSCFGNWNGFPGLSLMREFATQDALFLCGINYWRQDPHGEYETHFGIDESELVFKTLSQQIDSFYDLGFEVLYMYTSTQQELDLYQSYIWKARSYKTPLDSREAKLRYVNWIREYHGWSAWILRRRSF